MKNRKQTVKSSNPNIINYRAEKYTEQCMTKNATDGIFFSSNIQTPHSHLGNFSIPIHFQGETVHSYTRTHIHIYRKKKKEAEIQQRDDGVVC